jgi:undecaprenyl diphosphate synthase
MDGNARWAAARGLPKLEGHRQGALTLRNLLKPLIAADVKVLSVYAFSHENWHRPEQEVSDLMGLLDFYLKREVKNLIKNGIKLQTSGDLSLVPTSTRNALEQAVKNSATNDKLTLNICFSYGARQELLNAIRLIKASDIASEAINEATLEQYLYTAGLPDPDLLIRTGGDMRVSNFLLWQIAYCELYFTDILWPDFNETALHAAINDFRTRERRYGKR